MNILLVSKCTLDIEQYDEFKISVLLSLSKSLISLCWVTYVNLISKFMYNMDMSVNKVSWRI